MSGESLSCVVIDRVPFAPPSDPVEKVVTKSICKRTGMGEFEARIIPKACNLMQQAAGRLIRSSTDKGVVVCLDRRAVAGRMSARIMESFPPFPVSVSSVDINNYMMGNELAYPMKTVQFKSRTLSRFK